MNALSIADSITPEAYFKQNRPRLFWRVRMGFHMLSIFSEILFRCVPALRDKPAYVVAGLACLRGKVGESTDHNSNIETAAFYAKKEFERRVRLQLI